MQCYTSGPAYAAVHMLDVRRMHPAAMPGAWGVDSAAGGLPRWGDSCLNERDPGCSRQGQLQWG